MIRELLERLVALVVTERQAPRLIALLEVYCAHEGRLPPGTQKAIAQQFGVTTSVISQLWTHLPYELARHRRWMIEQRIITTPTDPLWLLAVKKEWWGDWANEEEDGYKAGDDYWKTGIRPEGVTLEWLDRRAAAVHALHQQLSQRVWRREAAPCSTQTQMCPHCHGTGRMPILNS